MRRTITGEAIRALEGRLRAEERSAATAEKYLRAANEFALWLGGRALTPERAAEWKRALQDAGQSAATVNAKLCAWRALLRTIGREDCRVKSLKVQRAAFRDPGRELTRREYERLLAAARSCGRERTALVMETLCACGLRVGELPCVTAEAARRGTAEVRMKGKIRVVLLPQKLCVKLLHFAAKQGVVSGCIFVTRTGRPLARRQIWGEMKSLCRLAKVPDSKVFPHNLRHLFAVEFYRATRDLVKLADVLGHSSVDTTRIYLITTGAEHRRKLDQLRLVI